MKKRETTYQRLKRENMALRQDIYKILEKPNDGETMIIKMKYLITFQTERIIWAGGTSL